MTVGSAFQELGSFLDGIERGTLRSVGLVESPDSDAPGALTATVELTVATSPAPTADADGTLSPLTATVDADGRLRVAFESAEPIVPTTDGDVTVELAGTSVEAGTVTVVLSVTARTDDALGEVTDLAASTERPEGTVVTEQSDGRTTTVRADDAAGGRTTATTVEEGTAGGETATDAGPDGRATTNADAVADTGAVGRGRTDGPTGTTHEGRDVPPFRDPALLAEVYDSCETFAEMADVLDVDVTAETVRRYMIDHDIHRPNSYDTDDEDSPDDGDDPDDGDEGTAGPDGGAGDGREASDEGNDANEENASDATPRDDDRERGAVGSVGRAAGNGADDEAADGRGTPRRNAVSGVSGADGAGPPVVLADGIGLPDDVEFETLVETVRRSTTVHEVAREMDVGRADALDVLREHDLLDLVVGRLSTEAEREIGREAVVERLREASTAR